ncbi:MAG TPA: hypothetical protein VNY05_02935 [Candidatus Acidoferrales bacterium]|jgi:hypothetical protein|nr:hypothetical protein [Candidatus Acidoferrales bacterium]
MDGSWAAVQNGWQIGLHRRAANRDAAGNPARRRREMAARHVEGPAETAETVLQRLRRRNRHG